MSCASCVGRVDKALAQVPGVLDVSVNLVTEEATVALDTGKADAETLVRAATGAGYPAQVVQARRARRKARAGRTAIQ